MSKRTTDGRVPRGAGATLRFNHAAIGAAPAVAETEKEMPRALASALSIPIDQVVPDPDQPRKTMDRARLEELAGSIVEHGILEPLLVREDGYLPDGRERYVVIAGGRRREAAIIAGQTRVPALLSDKQGMALRVIQLLENLQREDLPEVEEARAIKEIRAIMTMQRGGKEAPVHMLVSILHRSATYIEERLKLLDHADVADAVARDQVAPSTATLVAKVDDDDARAELLRRVKEEKLTRKEVQRLIGKRTVSVVEVDGETVGGAPTLREVAQAMDATEGEIGFAARVLRDDREMSPEEALMLARHTPLDERSETATLTAHGDGDAPVAAGTTLTGLAEADTPPATRGDLTVSENRERPTANARAEVVVDAGLTATSPRDEARAILPTAADRALARRVLDWQERHTLPIATARALLDTLDAWATHGEEAR